MHISCAARVGQLESCKHKRMLRNWKSLIITHHRQWLKYHPCLTNRYNYLLTEKRWKFKKKKQNWCRSVLETSPRSKSSTWRVNTFAPSAVRLSAWLSWSKEPHHSAVSSTLVHEQRVRDRTEDAGRMARMETGRLLQWEGIFRAGETTWGGKVLVIKAWWSELDP